MVRLLPAAVSVGLLVAGAIADIRGKGHILVYTRSQDGKPLYRIGCLNPAGRMTDNDCAVFNTKTEYPYTTSSELGDCSFKDPNAPVNNDSIFKFSHAFSCSGREAQATDSFFEWSTTPPEGPLLCNALTYCAYDVDLRTKPSSFSVWQYFYSSEQPGITPGHTQATFIWKKV